jgi:hypothetical protein
MDTGRIAKAGAEDEPAGTTASTLRVNNGTGEADRRTAARSPFFRLPRKPRDEIYDYVALSARTTYYDIALEANKQPQKIAYVNRGGSQFDAELGDAAQRRVRSLLLTGDRSGRQLCDPEPCHHVPNQEKLVKAEHHWLGGSQGRRADGSYGLNVHAFILVVPLYAVYAPSSVVFTFRFPGKEELGPRLRFNAYWGAISGKITFPDVDNSAVQELLSIARKVAWKGSIREYMIWRRYVVNHVRKEAC